MNIKCAHSQAMWDWDEFGEMSRHHCLCSEWVPSEWESDKNITITHTAPVHQLVSLEDKRWNKSISKTSIIHNSASSSETVHHVVSHIKIQPHICLKHDLCRFSPDSEQMTWSLEKVWLDYFSQQWWFEVKMMCWWWICFLQTHSFCLLHLNDNHCGYVIYPAAWRRWGVSTVLFYVVVRLKDGLRRSRCPWSWFTPAGSFPVSYAQGYTAGVVSIPHVLWKMTICYSVLLWVIWTSASEERHWKRSKMISH